MSTKYPEEMTVDTKVKAPVDKNQTTPQFWKKVFAHIEAGGYSMSGLTKDQIVKIIELMRTTTPEYTGYPARKIADVHGDSSTNELKLVAQMLKNVSPRTALVLYTLAWSSNSSLAKAGETREWKITVAMHQTFPFPPVPDTLVKCVHHRTCLYGWYADDCINYFENGKG